jgi:predicted acyltransferase
VGYWAAFALYPLPPAGFDYAKVGVSPAWMHEHGLAGLAAHWNKNSNLAWAFDTWLLNLFPGESRFAFNGGGYATLSFIPTLGTMILGLLAGGVLRGPRSPWSKVWFFVLGGLLLLACGGLLEWFGVCPAVKRIWTPSWTLWSGGWCFLFLAAFYAVIDIQRWQRWAFPLVVVGMNSIAAYCMEGLFSGPIREALKRHVSESVFTVFGTAYEPAVLGACVVLVLWLILFWMYRRKLFVRI